MFSEKQQVRDSSANPITPSATFPDQGQLPMLPKIGLLIGSTVDRSLKRLSATPEEESLALKIAALEYNGYHYLEASFDVPEFSTILTEKLAKIAETPIAKALQAQLNYAADHEQSPVIGLLVSFNQGEIVVSPGTGEMAPELLEEIKTFLSDRLEKIGRVEHALCYLDNFADSDFYLPSGGASDGLWVKQWGKWHDGDAELKLALRSSPIE